MGIYTQLKFQLLAEARDKDVRRWMTASSVVNPAVSLLVVCLYVPVMYVLVGS